MAEAPVDDEELLKNLSNLLDSKNRQIRYLKSQVSSLLQKLGEQDHFDHRNGSEGETSCCCACHIARESSVRDAESQTFASDFTHSDSTGSALDWATDGDKKESVSEILVKAIEKQSAASDYVFDSNYNMYYSPSTGYYYDTERNLLYEPYSQTYYKYNHENLSYELYCQASDSGTSNVNNTDCTEAVSDAVNGLKLSDSWSVEDSKRGSDATATTTATTAETTTTTAANVVMVKDGELTGKAGVHNRARRSRSHEKNCFDNVSRVKGSQSVKYNIALDDHNSSPEEGELLSESAESMSEDDESYCIVKSPSVFCGEKNSWPPCIRAIVKESSQQKIGSLLLITCMGGVIGREESSAIHVPDISISRTHAEITFDNNSWQYSITDLGSQNGTFVNDQRVKPGEGSDASHVLNHGDILRLGFCKWLIHIHPGSETCDDCEPGQVQAELSEHKENTTLPQTKEDKERARRLHLKQMKKKFGLENMNYDSHSDLYKSVTYEDRAEARRKTTGSQNPYEKDIRASLEESIPSSNKGYTMLKSMGWHEGQSLGSSISGIAEPIGIVQRRQDRAGLGSTSTFETPVENPKTKKWRKAQKRYHEAETNKK